MRFVIVTGMSGAGKTTALKMMEDMGYYCVDNLPIPLLTKFTELLLMPNEEITKVALGLDIRNRQNIQELKNVLKELGGMHVKYDILFLDSSDEVLVKRFKETRRRHPLAAGGRIETGIAVERERIAFLKAEADYILDTSRLLTRELKVELEKIFAEDIAFRNLYITVLSFGFKYGIPTDADLVFDVRFLPNPYYIDELRPLTGNDKAVREFVMENEVSRQFLQKLLDMTSFLIPYYEKEGKNQLVIAVGCTGGKHRSVTVANELYESLVKTEVEYGVKIEHRDIGKDAITKAK